MAARGVNYPPPTVRHRLKKKSPYTHAYTETDHSFYLEYLIIGGGDHCAALGLDDAGQQRGQGHLCDLRAALLGQRHTVRHHHLLN